MSQPISVSVQMDAASFHDFAAFDLLRHHKAWHRPLVFTAILLVSAGFCLSQVGQKDGAALLTWCWPWWRWACRPSTSGRFSTP